jgi:hypothetical protein
MLDRSVNVGQRGNTGATQRRGDRAIETPAITGSKGTACLSIENLNSRNIARTYAAFHVPLYIILTALRSTQASSLIAIAYRCLSAARCRTPRILDYPQLIPSNPPQPPSPFAPPSRPPLIQSCSSTMLRFTISDCH